jgi:hypothetical protein
MTSLPRRAASLEDASAARSATKHAAGHSISPFATAVSAAARPARRWSPGFTVRQADFDFTAGQPSTYRSSPKAQRSFCPGCGTQLTFKMDALDEIDVTVCSLDDPEAVPPHDHTYVSSQLGWVRLDDGLPRHGEARE